MGHPLIKRLSRIKDNAADKPSYIPASTFATALLHVLTGDESKPTQPTESEAQNSPANRLRNSDLLEQGINNLPDDLKRQLIALYQKADGNWDDFHKEIEQWYENMMDRAEGWYKRYVQKQTYLLAIIIVLWCNFDTLHVADRLWTDSALRSSVVEQAKARAESRPEESKDLPLVLYENPKDPSKGKPINAEKGPLSSEEQALIGSVTGWGQDIQELCNRRQRLSGSYAPLFSWFFMHLLGWTLSIFAISLGAPFWFDTLNRFMNLRNAGRAPDEPRAKNAGGQQKKEGE